MRFTVFMQDLWAIHQVDLAMTYGMIGLTIFATLSYLVRISLLGKVKYARVERQGGSVLLGTWLMSMAYWSLQPVGRCLVFFKVSPHVLSWLSFLFGIGAGVALAKGRFGVGASMAMISALLDTLDGMVARLRGVASNTGEILDTAVDRYAEFFYLGGLALYYRTEPLLLFICLFALAGSFMVSYSTAKAEAMGVVPERGIMRRPERAFYLILGAALSPLAISRWEPGVMDPLGYPMVAALILVAVLTNISTVDRMYSIVRQLRKLKPEQPEPPDDVQEESQENLEPEPI